MKTLADLFDSLELLNEFMEAGAEIEKQNGEWHLFNDEGENLASGETISAMIQDLLWRHD